MRESLLYSLHYIIYGDSVMYYYAVVDVNYIVTQIGMDEVEVNDPAWIPIDSENYDLVGLWYDVETQTYSHVGNKYLNPLKAVDGTGSGLDADLLDGKQASEFALANHTHPASAEVPEHEHDEYALVSHTHSEYANATHTHDYASSNHTHTGYASSGHNHDADYADIDHTHTGYASEGHSHTEYASASHTHATVNHNVTINKSNANVILKVSDLTKGTLPTAASYDGMAVQDKSGNILANMRYAQETDGDGFLQFKCFDYTGDASDYVDLRVVKPVGSQGYAQLPNLVKLRSGNQAIYETDDFMIFGTGNKPTLIACKSDSPVTVNGTRMDVPSLVPRNTNTHGIGLSGQRFTNCYLVNSPNVSSDRRLKQDIVDVDVEQMLDFIDRLNVVTYAYKNDPSVERIGLIAQDVEEAGGEKFVEVGEDGMYGLKTADLVYPLIGCNQALISRILTLESRIVELESQIKKE